MKKILYSAALLTLVAFSSCKKDYTCECTVSSNFGGSGTSSVTIHDSKKDAEDACKAMNATSSSGGATATQTCTIK